jgi:indolepyruvate ferredoxin oxidoreductase beta subunit
MKIVTSILFCGTGGQGILTAAEICARAAMNAGHHAKKSEVHGMAQRGGSVESHVRFGAEVFSPIIPLGGADILVPFEINEGKRLAVFLRPGGLDLSADLSAALSALQDRRALNTYMLGLLSRHLSLSEADWIAAIDAVLAERFRARNREIFLSARGKQ